MTLWLLAAWLACGLSTAAHAEPISLAIVGALGLTAGGIGATLVSAAVSIAVGTAISLGLGALQKSMAPKPAAGEALSGVEFNVQIGGDIARQIAVGKTALKGHLVFHNSYGPTNESYQQVYVLSDWISDSLVSVFVDGKRCVLISQGSPAPGQTNYMTAEYGGLIVVEFFDGTQTQASSSLQSLSQPPGRWDANSRLTGMTYVIVYFTYALNNPLYEQGIPQLTFEMRGARLYDPRQDSTNGGSGAHRWDTISTWRYTENPTIAAYNFQRGFYKNGELILGMGVPDSRMLRETYFSSANICDETVTLQVGGTEPRYRIATILSADEGVTYGQTLDVILSTCAGYLYDYSGFYYFQAGAGYAPAATITDAEIVVGTTPQFAAKRSRAELFNGVHGQFLNAAIDYQPQSYTAQINTAAVNSDTEELGKALNLLSVPSQYQAERIAQIRLREARRQATAGVTLGFHRQNLQAGDWIVWNSARYGNGTYRIVTRSVDPTTRTVSLELAQVDANVFSWNSADEGIEVRPVTGILTVALASTVSNFGVQAINLVGSDGTSIPALKFTWQPIADPTIVAVVIEYRRKNQPQTAARISDPSPADGVFTTSSNVAAGVDYEARATIETNPPRVTTWTPWMSVLTTEFAGLTVTLDQFYDLIDQEVPLAAPSIPNANITSAIDRQPDGTIFTVVTVSMQVVANAVSYEFEIQEGFGTWFSYPAATATHQWRGRFSPGTLIHIRARALTALNTPSAYSAVDATHGTHTVVSNLTPPTTPSGLAAFASFQSIFLTWNRAPESDYNFTEIWESPVNDVNSTNFIFTTSGDRFTRTAVPTGTTRYYWVRHLNTSGTASAFNAPRFNGVVATTQQAITADLANQSITAQKVAYGSRNVAFNPQFRLGTDGRLGWTPVGNGQGSAGVFETSIGEFWNPAGTRDYMVRYSGTPSGGDMYVINQLVNQSGGLQRYTVVAGNWYQASVCLSMHRCNGQILLQFFDAAGNFLSGPGGNVIGTNGAQGGAIRDFPTSSVIAQAPSGAVTAWIIPYAFFNGGSDCYMFVSCPVFAGCSPGQTQVDPYTEPGITIIDGGNVRTQSIVTEHMVANSIAGDRITADSLNANRIQANTTLSQTLIVAGGNTLATINTNAATGAQDPATRINANSTTINPGRILIAGGTTLDNWRDVTEIRGGAIKAYSIEAETLKISGQSENLVINSDFRPEGPNPCALAGGNVGYNPQLVVGNPSWGIPGSSAVYGEWGGNFIGSGAYYDIYVFSVSPTGAHAQFDVYANNWYEVSVSVSVHHCQATAYVIFTDASFNYFGQINCTTNDGTSGSVGGKALLVPPHRMRGIGVSPANATHAYILLRQLFPGGTQPYAFFSGLHFGFTLDPSYVTQWSPRTNTLIHGGQITTGSINADRIRANSIDANQIRSDAIVITSLAQMANVVIGTANIDNLSVTTLKIANRNVTSGNNAAYTVGPFGGAIELYYVCTEGALLLISMGAHNQVETNVSTPQLDFVPRTYTFNDNVHGGQFSIYSLNVPNQTIYNGFGGYYWYSRPPAVFGQRIVGPFAPGLHRFSCDNPSTNNMDMWITVSEYFK